MADFQIKISPKSFSDGRIEESAEERATQGLIAVEAGGTCLSECFDDPSRVRQDGPVVPTHHLAEWLLENWWRLRYEPQVSNPDANYWWQSHNFTGIGEGYLWPDITITSDGRLTVIRSVPSVVTHTSHFGYFGSPRPVILPWSSVERGIDGFVENVMELLSTKGLRNTNLDVLWADISAERENIALGRLRRFEALLGAYPDEFPEKELRIRLADSAALGDEAVDELAAAASGRGVDSMLTAEDIRDMSNGHGAEMRISDALALNDRLSTDCSQDKSAAEVGVSAAREVRIQAQLGDEKMDDRRLAEIAGVSVRDIDKWTRDQPISFTLSNGGDNTRMVLRGAYHENRRFNLARLVGDRMMWKESLMRPSTDAKTYRQKAQRAFASELLAPIDAVVDRMNEDYSDEKIEDVARQFGVSNMVIDRSLKNNRVVDRDDSDFADAA